MICVVRGKIKQGDELLDVTASLTLAEVKGLEQRGSESATTLTG